MINFNNLTYTRVIMHSIKQKEIGQDSSEYITSNSLINVDESVIDTIKRRLSDAAGKNSRAFELEIENINPGSFFSLSNDISTLNEDDFIQRSKDIAELLATNQVHRSIPGGFLIILEANDSENKSYIIIIKAEPHEALRLVNDNEIKLLEKVFLSPSQKLYKIGVLYSKTNDIIIEEGIDVNIKFNALLFDDQFRLDGHPAEYFYKDFLGLSINKNSKIQTLSFYNKSQLFIKSISDSSVNKLDLLSSLKVFVKSVVSPIITPVEFAESFLTGSIKDEYISQVVRKHPSSFIRDTLLINSSLKNKKITFSDKIKIIGPEDGFENYVQILDNLDVYNDLSIDSEYSLLMIKGKPFSNDN
jgi:hypothetical protein